MTRSVLRPSLRFAAQILAQGAVVLAGTTMVRLALAHLERLGPGATTERVTTLAGTAVGLIVFFVVLHRLNHRFRDFLDAQDRRPVQALRERAYETWRAARRGGS